MIHVLDIPPEQLKRIPLETIVLLLCGSVDKEDLHGLSIGIPMNGVNVRISIETEW